MTAPNEPSGSAPALRPRRWSSIRPATAAVLGARVLHLGALLVGGQREHEHPGVVARAVSIIGSSEPKPRYGLAVIASAASGELGSR